MAASSKSEQLQIRVSAAQKAAIQARAKRAGVDMSSYVLSRVLPEVARQFDDCVRSIARRQASRFGLAELNALLSRWTAPEIEAAVRERPSADLSPYVANYVAAMVELACARHGLQVPTWINDIPPLAEPVFGSSLTSLRLHLLTHSPPAFRRRNLFIDSSLGAQV
jgi:uncharacterized protein (DUF1778 family)